MRVQADCSESTETFDGVKPIIFIFLQQKQARFKEVKPQSTSLGLTGVCYS